MTKAVFIDKDGTLIYDIPYNVDPEKIQFQEGVIEALQAFQNNGYLLFVITNQSGVAQGFFDEEELWKIETKLHQLLKDAGICLSGFYYCPHFPEGRNKEYVLECSCRKPQPGLILKAAKDYDINLETSWMIGDILNDVEAGNRAGCQTILLDNGNETEWIMNEFRSPTKTISHFSEAVDFILGCHSKKLTNGGLEKL